MVISSFFLFVSKIYMVKKILNFVLDKYKNILILISYFECQHFLFRYLFSKQDTVV